MRRSAGENPKEEGGTTGVATSSGRDPGGFPTAYSENVVHASFVDGRGRIARYPLVRHTRAPVSARLMGLLPLPSSWAGSLPLHRGPTRGDCRTQFSALVHASRPSLADLYANFFFIGNWYSDVHSADAFWCERDRVLMYASSSSAGRGWQTGSAPRHSEIVLARVESLQQLTACIEGMHL